jgi:limonene-1,2-epoxide hydrolase
VTPPTTPIETVAAFWAALYDRDWDRIASFFGPESVYWDVPAGATTAAKGPAGIVARLQIGLAGLAGYDHDHLRVVADGDTVMTEHAETWRWATGEEVTLPFVSVQVVRGNTILLWKDYWDYQTLMDAAPAAWHERLATADVSWLFDATGIR